MEDRDSAEGTGLYPYYSALWHLEEIGVFDPETGTSEVWESLLQQGEIIPTRVALIDNSVAWSHPNLEGAIDKDLMIDFLSAELGAFPWPAADEQAEPSSRTDRISSLSGWEIAGDCAEKSGSGCAEFLSELMQRLQDPTTGQKTIRPATDPAFSAHGTAMAGLIGARPTVVQGVAPGVTGKLPGTVIESITSIAEVLPYAGVDPFCKIVPISTSFDSDPKQLILALLYADIIDSDVIVIARDFPDPRFAEPARDDSAEVSELWKELESLIENISQRRVILCAAGNGEDNQLIYPASLGSESNGIIPVGARAASGNVAGYSPVDLRYGVFAPSGDSERLDREVQRVDTLSATFEPDLHGSQYLGHLASTESERLDQSVFSSLDLISTDVPGKYGYNGSPVNETSNGDVTDFGSYFCRFSGTSGAVAVAAGLISLAYCTGVLSRKTSTAGIEAKSIVLGAKNRMDKGFDSQSNAVPVLSWGMLREHGKSGTSF